MNLMNFKNSKNLILNCSGSRAQARNFENFMSLMNLMIFPLNSLNSLNY